MGRWLQELLEAIKKKKDLPLINSEDSGDEEMEEDVFSEELGDF